MLVSGRVPGKEHIQSKTLTELGRLPEFDWHKAWMLAPVHCPPWGFHDPPQLLSPVENGILESMDPHIRREASWISWKYWSCLIQACNAYMSTTLMMFSYGSPATNGSDLPRKGRTTSCWPRWPSAADPCQDNWCRPRRLEVWMHILELLNGPVRLG